MPPVTEWSPPIATARVPASAMAANAVAMRAMLASLSFASGSATSPRSWMTQASQGEKPNGPCMRRCSAETWRTARGPRCWSRSVDPFPVLCGTPTRAMSQRAGSGSTGQRNRVAGPHQ